MQCIIGLGNHESRYDGTRHNVGFEVVESLARELNLPFKPGRGEYLLAECSYKGAPLVLIKPLTFMNESGFAVVEVLEHFDLSLDRILIVCDDFQLPLGRLRLRLSGSDGGHNGLYSVIYHLQSDQFLRLRCGIASASTPRDKSLMADYVLDPFAAEERPLVDKMIERAREACLSVVAEGKTYTMNKFNSKQVS